MEKGWRPEDFSPRDEIFVQEYLRTSNAYQSAIKAGYSETTAVTKSSHWVRNSTTNHKIWIYHKIRETMDRRAKKMEVTQERILAEYAKIAFADVTKVLDADGKLKPLREIDEAPAGAISNIEFDRDGMPAQVKLSDKKAALDSLARHLGMFTDKSEVTLKFGLADRLDKLRDITPKQEVIEHQPQQGVANGLLDALRAQEDISEVMDGE